MSLLSRDLRREIAGEQRNPLEQLGVSGQILNLGLTNDDLYNYITKDVARRLVMRFHPDRAVGGVDTAQREIAAAYAQIQDRDRFERALSEFRESKSQQRSDDRVYQFRLMRLEQQVRDGLIREREFRDDIERMKTTLAREQAQTFDERKILPRLEQVVTHQAKSITRLRRLRRARRQQAADYYKFIRRVCDGQHGALGVRWICVARPLRTGEIRREPAEALRALGVSDEHIDELARTFQRLQRVSLVTLVCEILPVENGRVRYASDSRSGSVWWTVLGSMPPAKRWAEVFQPRDVMIARTTEVRHGRLLVLTRERRQERRSQLVRDTRLLILEIGR